MIDRKKLVRRHSPVLNFADKESPLTVGNGEFAFTADITGFQTLYNEYTPVPLCTMSNFAWHTKPDNGRIYTHTDVEMTHYRHNGRRVSYASEIKEGNEAAYNWLRQNPHRLNLAKISLLWDNLEIKCEDISEVRQELCLYTGIIYSKFKVFGHSVEVETICAQSCNVLGFSVKSEQSERLSVAFTFPYGSHKITACDWDNPNHSIDCKRENNVFHIRHTLDNDVYYADINSDADIKQIGDYTIVLSGNISELTAAFSDEKHINQMTLSDIRSDSIHKWESYWNSGGAVDLGKSTDSRACELERRIVLSQYQIAVNSAGSMPPQETGLVCNSWYGKLHLEMHILHSGWLPLWGKCDLLEKSIGWYEKIICNAEKNAARNGNKGARWVKMTGPEGVDSPSKIAVLLIWQQPHIIYMLELIKRGKKREEQAEFMRRYWKLVSSTADFMADFAIFNEKTACFDLLPPIIPAQEEHKPQDVINPAFELCYWEFGLKTAVLWARELNLYDEQVKLWEQVGNNMAIPPIKDGVYIAHENCPDTFSSYNRDHPSMLFGYGFLNSGLINKNIMDKTMDMVLKNWDFRTCWGWDFALMAMTLAKLGKKEEAIDVLLMNTEKNSYVTCGNNYQRGRTDLPLYLPGNGSLLFALAYILSVGFPENGKWNVEYENIFSPH